MERALMVIQRSSLVQGHTTVESKRSGFVSTVLLAAGFAVATLSPLSSAHASHTAKHQDQAASHASRSANDAVASGPKANADKKADAKAAREKKKAEKAAKREEKLAKAKAGKKERGDGDKVAKADSKPMNDDMGGSDDPLEGL
jgi:hypothetical protein